MAGPARSLDRRSCRVRLRALAPFVSHPTTHSSASLRHGLFPRLASAYTVNELGNWLGDVALAVLVYDATASALATAALFIAARLVPSLLAPVVVARVEGSRRRGAVAGLYAIEAIIFAALAVVAAVGFSLPAILVLAAVDGTLALSGRALVRAAVVSELGAGDQLRRGNAVLNGGLTVSAAAGPAVAGLLVSGAGVSAALVLDAASFAAAAAVLVGVATPGPQPTSPLLARVREALAHVRADRRLTGLLGAEALALVWFAAVIPVEVVFAKGTLHAGSSGYGALLASWGVGMIAGAVLFARARRWALERLLAWSTLAIAVSYGGVSLAPSLTVACGASVVGGVGNGVQWVSLVSAVQALGPPALLPRLMALVESIGAAAPVVGFVAGGVLASAFSARSAYAVAGLAAGLAAGVFAVLARAGTFEGGRLDGREGDNDASAPETPVAPARTPASP